MQKLDQLVAELLEEECGEIGENAPFADCEGWDSLKHVELVVGIESRYKVDLSAGEIARLTSKRMVREVLAGRGLHD